MQGAGAETFQYDAVGRLAGHGSDLGAFTLGYLGQTSQITSRQQHAGHDLELPHQHRRPPPHRHQQRRFVLGPLLDLRLHHQRPRIFIGAITETSDASAVDLLAGSQTATYNNLNQLTKPPEPGLRLTTPSAT